MKKSKKARLANDKYFHSYTPNKKTRKAIENTRKNNTTKAKNFDDLCNQLGI